MAELKAVSLWQPWATLIRAGAKTIETRSWATKHRGRIAIHAAKRPVKNGTRVGDYLVVQNADDGWQYVVRWPAGEPLDPHEPWHWLGFGFVVATATLTACAPIGGPYSFRTGIVQGDEGDYPGEPVVVRHPPLLDLPERLVLDHGTVTDISGQLPYGDYTDGRWAWLLADVDAILPQVPARGRQQLFTVDLEEAARG